MLYIFLSVFIIAFAAIVVAKRKLAVFFFIVSSHFDLGAGAAIASAAKLQYLNAAKIILFPLLLGLRLNNWRLTYKFDYLAAIWSAFFVICMLSIVRTPDPFLESSIKQIGYFAAYVVVFFSLKRAWEQELITENVQKYLIFLCSAIALLQTYVLGNPFGETLHYSRYVSFTSKQQFGEFLFAIGVLVLYEHRFSVWMRWSLYGIVFVQLLMNGSRTGVIAAVTGLMVYVFRRSMLWAITTTLVLLSGVLSFVAFNDEILSYIEDVGGGARVYELVAAVKDGGGVEQVGTLNARIQFYRATFDKITDGPVLDLLVGRGLSSSGQLARKVEGADPNRTMHNEFLRVLYELGLVGFLIFVLGLTLLFLRGVRYKIFSGDLVYGFFPGFIMFLLVENIFTGSGAAGGIAFVLVLAKVLSEGSSEEKREGE